MARGRQVLSGNQFPDQEAINAYSEKVQETYDEYMEAKTACERKPRKYFPFFSSSQQLCCYAATGVLYYLGESNYFTLHYGVNPMLLLGIFNGAAIVFYLLGLFLSLRQKRSQKDMNMSAKMLQELLSRHLNSRRSPRKPSETFRSGWRNIPVYVLL